MAFDSGRAAQELVVVQTKAEGVIGGDETANDGAGRAAEAALRWNLANRAQPVRASRGRGQRSEGAKGEIAPRVSGHVFEELARRLNGVAGGWLELVLVAHINGKAEHVEARAQVAGGRGDGYACAASHRPRPPRGPAAGIDPRTTCIDCCRNGAAPRCE